MKCNRYIAGESTVVIELDNFVYGIKITTMYNLDVIEMLPEDAEYFYNKFQEVISREDILSEITAKGYDLNNKVEPIIIN